MHQVQQPLRNSDHEGGYIVVLLHPLNRNLPLKLVLPPLQGGGGPLFADAVLGLLRNITDTSTARVLWQSLSPPDKSPTPQSSIPPK